MSLGHRVVGILQVHQFIVIEFKEFIKLKLACSIGVVIELRHIVAFHMAFLLMGLVAYLRQLGNQQDRAMEEVRD